MTTDRQGVVIIAALTHHSDMREHQIEVVVVVAAEGTTIEAETHLANIEIDIVTVMEVEGSEKEVEIEMDHDTTMDDTEEDIEEVEVDHHLTVVA